MGLRFPDEAPKQRDPNPAETVAATNTSYRTGKGYDKPNVASVQKSAQAQSTLVGAERSPSSSQAISGSDRSVQTAEKAKDTHKYATPKREELKHQCGEQFCSRSCGVDQLWSVSRVFRSQWVGLSTGIISAYKIIF